MLAGYDLKSRKPIWSVELIARSAVTNEGNKRYKEMQAEVERQISLGLHERMHMPTLDEVIEGLQRTAEAELRLRVSGENVWIAKEDKLTQYDWASGKSGKEITVPQTYTMPF